MYSSCIRLYPAVKANVGNRLIVFGNSLSDIGNLFTQPLTNGVQWWMGRFSNGPVWNEYLAKWSGSTLINYAYGGATSNNTGIELFDNIKITVPDAYKQIGMFNSTFHGLFSKAVLSNDIAAIEIGGNDVLDGLSGLSSGAVDLDTYSSSIASSIGSSISRLTDMGYKRILVSNIPDISSSARAFTFPAPLRQQLVTFITAINTKTQVFISQFTQNKGLDLEYIRVLDFFGLVYQLQNPIVSAAMGLKNTTSPCSVTNTDGSLISACTDSSKYAFMDDIHPTTKVHALVGAAARSILLDEKFTITTDSVLGLISAYKIDDISTSNNPLFIADSFTTGVTNVPSYKVVRSAHDAAAIARVANEVAAAYASAWQSPTYEGALLSTTSSPVYITGPSKIPAYSTIRFSSYIRLGCRA
ncbi:Thermolabile hemolysin [Zancudomyces culisetae]|uniref:Thermolabile hemolysin n=1 Tax=Zancudomyces culisetae TaxID=1213189 RepID=A0A1R1PQQ1_ZANCU|nr:Thermolabile hemolysin [Zancudomyces culisetae]OMH85616.1 Thermolabile hemolysin [Zancudomyces culisetae]|eukprot:OMH83316.1 Thermolabile hemolysin [Zancudomyces culisetae]